MLVNRISRPAALFLRSSAIASSSPRLFQFHGRSFAWEKQTHWQKVDRKEKPLGYDYKDKTEETSEFEKNVMLFKRNKGSVKVMMFLFAGTLLYIAYANVTQRGGIRPTYLALLHKKKEIKQKIDEYADAASEYMPFLQHQHVLYEKELLQYDEKQTGVMKLVDLRTLLNYVEDPPISLNELDRVLRFGPMDAQAWINYPTLIEYIRAVRAAKVHLGHKENRYNGFAAPDVLIESLKECGFPATEDEIEETVRTFLPNKKGRIPVDAVFGRILASRKILHAFEGETQLSREMKRLNLDGVVDRFSGIGERFKLAFAGVNTPQQPASSSDSSASSSPAQTTPSNDAEPASS